MIVAEHSLLQLPIPHYVEDFGIEARKPQGAWVSAFNGPIHRWIDPDTHAETYGVTVRLSRMKDPVTRELYSTNLMFYMSPEEMQGVHNIYDLGRTTPFTRILGPHQRIPDCVERPGQLWYDPNPEGLIMEDVRMAPVMLPTNQPGFFVTGQGYRGKLMMPNGKFIHDVGVYGGYLDPEERPGQLHLNYLFGGLEFRDHLSGNLEDNYLTQLGPSLWAKGIVGNAVDEIHVESYKNSVLLPSPDSRATWIGARSMSETKLLYYFETHDPSRLSGYRLGGFIDGLPQAVGEELWKRVHRVGLGSNFLECPELNGYVGIIHVVIARNDPRFPDTYDRDYPEIEEAYEGWFVLLRFTDKGEPVICACIRALTADDVPKSYHGNGELFDTKRVAFPISLYRKGDEVSVGYGWGDRALFLAHYDYDIVVDRLRDQAPHTAGPAICGGSME